MYYSGLHNHSDCSNLRLIDSINKVEDIIDYAHELNMPAIAITDHESLSSHVKALEYWQKKYKEEGKLKLILGNEIYMVREGLTESNVEKGESYYHLILLAKDAIGYKQLRQLSSRAWERGFFRMMMRVFNYPSDLFEIIGANPGHIICTSACLGSYTGKKVLAQEYDKVDNYITTLANLFGKDNYYLEIQPSETEDQVIYNSYLLEHYWGKYPFIFTTDAHYLKKEDRELHKSFLNSKDGDREVDEFYASAYMMSFDEVKEYFKDYIDEDKIEEMAQNTNKIADMCSFYDLKRPQVITKVSHDEIEDNRNIFDNIVDYNKNPYINYYRHTENESDKYFFELVMNGWKKEVTADKYEKYIPRMEEELTAIREISNKINLPLSDYFTSMAKMIDIIWNEADSIVGVSRGSAGAFLINYLLGITQMNPMEQGIPLYPWRFLHPSRPELPDIDVDTESSKRTKVFNKVQAYFRSIGGDVYNICTFGTEGSKSAIRTAARGLGVDLDVVSYLGSMIPNERGFDWTLSQCYNGDEEHIAIKAFRKEMDKYPELWALACKIEGLITRLGVHASGIVCVNGDFNDYNSIMKTSKNQVVSAYDLHDSEKCGLVKYDFLTVSALDRIRQTFNYLLEDTVIFWQGNLKATYDKYLDPKVLDYTSPDMWKMVGEGKITSLFQFDTAVGSQAIKQIQPKNLTEMAVANTVMRLMSDVELPLARYVRYKNNINFWYTDMAMAGLSAKDVKILEKHLLATSGIADSQESIMMLSMDPEISGFTMEEANKLRKTVAKKQFDQIENIKQLFYKKGEECNASKQLLDYIWYQEISLSLGYSFSIVHTTGYSTLALQEMNLAYHYPIIYWNCACLSVDASAINEEDFYNLMDEGIVEISDEEDKRNSNKTDYAKIASAIDKFRHSANIKTPDINKSRLGFTPDVEHNTIIYGLKGINRVTSPVIQEIISKRPFKSFDDFLSKISRRIITKDKIVNLIKSGAFNRLENKTTAEILSTFLNTTANLKKKLNMQNMNMLIDYNILPSEFDFEKKMYKFTKVLREFRDDDKLYYILSDRIDKDSIIKMGQEIKNITLPNGRIAEVIDSSKWDNQVYTPTMNKPKKYIKEHELDLLQKLNNALFAEEYNKYASGDNLQWELDSLNLYFTDDPLKNTAQDLPIRISNINDVVEGETDGFFLIKGKEIPKMVLYSIIGTVLDRNTTKGLVTIQTPNGVIGVKLYKDLFAFYNNATEGEESFFEKGTHLLITGIKRGDTFIPKVYRNTGIKSILKIILDDKNKFVRLEGKIDAN